jgi:outer membrane protein assembly factor BamB
MLTRRQSLLALTGASLSHFRSSAAEPDWPQWRGPNRDGLSPESGLGKEFPASGPPKLWTAGSLGAGYGSVSMAGSRLFVQGAVGGKSMVHCLNRSDGKPIWSVALGPEATNDRGSGPRSTPTLDADRAYVLTESGDLACLKTDDGSVVWRKNLIRDFKGDNPYWLLSESPLVDGNRLIVTPGAKGATLVALDKLTGKWLWSSAELSDGPGYASAIAVQVGSIRAIAQLTANAGVGVRASDGKLLWRYTNPANRTANCTTPVFHDGAVFYTSAYGTGCGLLRVAQDGDSVKSEEAYFNREMMNHHGGVVLVNGHVYGFSNSILTCMEWATGAVKWRDRSVGKGSLTYADGKLFLLGEGHTAAVADASPSGYKEWGRFKIADKGLPAWAHPVVCGGKLYLRNQDTLECYDIKA